METITEILINPESRVPKYQQIINSIIHDIEKGNLKVGQKIPSINEISEEYYLSRDTVEKAYNKLKKKKIIVSAKGKGYYIAKTSMISKINILFLLNKPSSYKMIIYNAFVKSLEENAHVDVHIYHCDSKIFLSILEEKMGGYDYYVIMSHFKNSRGSHANHLDATLQALKKIPADKLILLDNDVPELANHCATVYQDFKMDIFGALTEALPLIRKYEKIAIVYHPFAVYPYPKEILTGFRKFCDENFLDFEVIDEFDEPEVRKNTAYILVEESDLVNLIKRARDLDMKPGEDIGVISYNDTPLKELLGITVISTDFKLMGETAAYMIKKNKQEKVKNAFRLIRRSSI